ncbi:MULTISPECIES: NADH-quinone oxidoreductase subunit NuoF [unclassified Thermosipho (in: thermotogales)]|uniref:NADH-quinone oxidoreductase subunit NuoF n=1 Tax=unclassified Thermosipho (in: thermotogales) TaxID=2676525 RepID=UPI0009872AC9|nr:MULTISPECIES: NADH-quinone oxidoreductase subunit NuoF [unclassified Thermosipho (in: thermotogales)]MBT1248239.1 NADH dehydrogenase [Thermosipho sp. 1244]OOC46497.1 NADH dehydrogenase [Thermosipho sp. 1223]
MPLETNTILICAGGACISAGEESVKDVLERKIKEYNLQDNIKIVETGCMGACSLGPIMVIHPEGVYYQKLTPEAAEKIVEEHLLKGRIVEEYLYQGDKGKIVPQPQKEIPFFSRQVKIATRNVGIINPLNIDEYIARDGYFALHKALKEMKPEEVIQVVKDSGLRGRGGAGFPTGLKWEFARKSPGDEKYMICNADEGDPGAFMDRSILEGDPHTIIEAMTIAGYAIGATKGFVYLRAEYPIAIERLTVALNQAREYGFLGENILGTDFSFDIEIRIGAGAFVCGEETALMHSIEGKRGQPRVKPPFPAQKGLWGKPSNINNVETLACVPPIIYHGANWFRQWGTEKSPGTKVFALAGKVKNTGLVEVPMGITLRELIYEIGGGSPTGKKIKAVQTGGPSGGVIPEEYFDTPVDYESLQKLGAIVGSGGLIVLDEDDCMVDVAKFFLEFTVDESCGKCTPCREGTKKMYEILDKITKGEGTEEDIEILENLGNVIKDSSLCGLGQTAPNPVLSTLRYYKDEYLAHVREKKCPANKCKALISYVIDPEKCVGCTACARVCPASCISGEVRKVHEIDQSACVKCGSCIEVCRFGAISKVTPAIE